MSWTDFECIVLDEAGRELGEAILARLRADFGGTRLTIAARRARLTKEQMIEALENARQSAPEAARRLGVHRATLYRALRRPSR